MTRLIEIDELEAMLQETGGVRVTHEGTSTWGHWRGNPMLAFVEPGIRDVDQFVKIVDEKLPDAVLDETITVERVDDAGVATLTATFRVRDRQPDPHAGFADLYLQVMPGGSGPTPTP